MKTKDMEPLGRQRAKASKIKAWSSWPTQRTWGGASSRWVAWCRTWGSTWDGVVPAGPRELSPALNHRSRTQPASPCSDWRSVDMMCSHHTRLTDRQTHIQPDTDRQTDRQTDKRSTDKIIHFNTLWTLASKKFRAITLRCPIIIYSSRKHQFWTGRYTGPSVWVVEG